MFKKFLYKVWSKFLDIFGDIKIFKFPLWVVYDPDDYEVDGVATEKALKTLKRGDIIFRGYNRYLDGKFISSKRKYSHGAIYVGDGKIIHAISKGCSYINAIDFMRCDRICILRPKRGITAALKLAKSFVKNNIPYDFGFSRGVSSLYCFELCAECYPKLEIIKKYPSALFGLIKKRDGVYLSDSFFESKDFDVVFEHNPKFNILEK
jgi:uncharacterized protein YycO